MRWLLALLLVQLAGAQAVTVAILDDGVDAEHDELAGRVERVSFSGPELPIDPGTQGNATGIASLVAGTTLGIVPNANVLDLQVKDAIADVGPTPSDAASAALEWLLAQDDLPDVVLISFTPVGREAGKTLAAQARSLADDGVIVVVPAAAGATDLHASGAVVTVAAVEACAGSLEEAGRPLKPDLSAPGSGLTIAVRSTPADRGPTGVSQGASFAAAQVAGAAAAVRQEFPAMPAPVVTALLRGEAWDSCDGWGELNLDNTLTRARTWAPVGRSEATAGPAIVLGLGILAFAARRRNV